MAEEVHMIRNEWTPWTAQQRTVQIPTSCNCVSLVTPECLTKSWSNDYHPIRVLIHLNMTGGISSPLRDLWFDVQQVYHRRLSICVLLYLPLIFSAHNYVRILSYGKMLCTLYLGRQMLGANAPSGCNLASGDMWLHISVRASNWDSTNLLKLQGSTSCTTYKCANRSIQIKSSCYFRVLVW